MKASFWIYGLYLWYMQFGNLLRKQPRTQEIQKNWVYEIESNSLYSIHHWYQSCMVSIIDWQLSFHIHYCHNLLKTICNPKQTGFYLNIKSNSGLEVYFKDKYVCFLVCCKLLVEYCLETQINYGTYLRFSLRKAAVQCLWTIFVL